MLTPQNSIDYRMQVWRDPSQLDPARWDALAADDPSLNVFGSALFAQALWHSGDIAGASGWHPEFLRLSRNGAEVAGAALYRKDHSYGEFVFDWAWAEAYAQHGLDYYPKLVVAAPFSPVPGARLLARDDDARAAMAQALIEYARHQRLSSVHVLFGSSADQAALIERGFAPAQHIQFHWTNKGYADFDAFLSALTQSKRKKIRAERQKVARAGLHLVCKRGAAIEPADWRFFYACYARTYAEHRSMPYLSPDFFPTLQALLSATGAGDCLMVVAANDAGPVAASLLVYDARANRLYGRYWGALEAYDCLHFEACYYTPIAYAIEHRIGAIEGGAQGEHKLARGFDPVLAHSAHWIADARFRAAIEAYLADARRAVQARFNLLCAHGAYRTQRSESNLESMPVTVAPALDSSNETTTATTVTTASSDWHSPASSPPDDEGGF